MRQIEMDRNTDVCDVALFHSKFDLGLPGSPRLIEPALFARRSEHLVEELAELMSAWRAASLPLVADALVDLAYCSIGTALLLGCERIWRSLPPCAELREVYQCLGVAEPEPRLPTEAEFCSRFQLVYANLQRFDAEHRGGDVFGAERALRRVLHEVYTAAIGSGLPWELLWKEVHAANMRKARHGSGSGGDASKQGIYKPEGWAPPDIEGILARCAR